MKISDRSLIETTAHTLSATLGFLAIHQEEQDQAVDEIQENIPGRKDPVSDLHY